ncbi:MAG: GH92 family glycosyl hydrolase [Flavobacteriales bacterium]
MLNRTLIALLLSPTVMHAQDTTTWVTNFATELVNPFVGTGGHGHTFPGACVPFGMVQLSPDTRTDAQEWDGCGGYHYSDSLIYGFSHTHLSGTGVSDLCDVLIMPLSGDATTNPEEYRSHFSHQREEAHAGFYKVHLDDPDVDAELTTTARVGMHRYRFAKPQERAFVLDLRHRDRLTRSSIQQTGPQEICGERRSSGWARDQRLFYCIRFSENVTLVKDLSDSSKAVLQLGDGKETLVKVGISAVSIEGARKNLDTEISGWDFDGVKKNVEAAWNKELGRIEVQGGTREQQRIFYTALYHSLLVPYLFNDVDRKYRGNDGNVHASDHDVYTVFSLWDTFRAEHPLFTILEPDRTVDFIKTFLDIYSQTGRLPVWELWGNETDCMIGYHSVSVIADAYMKGIRGFDAELALKAMEASADRDETGLNALRAKGYISSEDQSESVSRTLEYAYDDWCIATMAKAMGKDSLATVFFSRASNWRNVFDPESGFFRARHNGGFKGPFDPFEVNFDYTEANAWQYSTFVPQDVDGLDRTLKNTGHGGVEQRLDELFSAKDQTHGRDQSDITGLIGQYAHGNEPSHAMAWMYDRVGRPDKAQRMVDRILNELYHDAPDGLSGNEDCGQMSAWSVMGALGLYQIAPGDPRFELHAPLFHAYRIHLPNGNEVNVRSTGDRNGARVIGSTELNGVKGLEEDIPYSTLMKGMDLKLNLTSEWRPSDRPASTIKHPLLESAYDQDPDRTYPPSSPVITAPAEAFTGPMAIRLETLRPSDRIFYTVDGSQPTQNSTVYREPFTIDTTTTVKALAVNGSSVSPVITAHYAWLDPARTITVESKWSAQYPAAGEIALIDGVRGTRDFRVGGWQGFLGEDVLATVDLGSVKVLKRVGLGVLQDAWSWIWYPRSVQFAWSTNGRTWSSATVENTVPRDSGGSQKMDMMTELLNKHARYIKVIAKNPGPCPDWHPGKGDPSFIFADELLIECE